MYKGKRSVLIIIAVAVIGVVVCFKYLLPLFLPFLFGYFIAWLSGPILTVLHIKFRIPKNIAGILTVSVFIVLFGVISYLLIRLLLYQADHLIEHMPAIKEQMAVRMNSICLQCDRMLHLRKGTIGTTVLNQIDGITDSFQKNLIPQFSDEACDIARWFVKFIWNVAIIFISALLFTKDYEDIKEEYRDCLFYREFHMVTGVLSDMGIAYFKAQLFLMCIIAGVVSLGVFLTGNHYALLIGIGVAVFDAFPILGSSLILIPWALILLWKKHFIHAVIILVTYLICQLIRQILEPKLVGDRIGVRSIYTLMSIYIGVRIYGTFGFILGPISLVAIKAIITGIMVREEKAEFANVNQK